MGWNYITQYLILHEYPGIFMSLPRYKSLQIYKIFELLNLSSFQFNVQKFLKFYFKFQKIGAPEKCKAQL